MSLSEEIARWATEYPDEDFPPQVEEFSKLRILDIVGCMLGAARHVDVKSCRNAVLSTFPGQQTRSVPFVDEMSIAGAALVNGTAALVLEFDDSHLQAGIHTSSPVISAALPVAMSRAISGRQLIGAVAIGNEMCCRLGLVAAGKFHPSGFHPTGLFGTFGAIVAAARCLSLDARQLANALGLGGSLSAALMASWEDGSAAKSLHAGFSALAAINATSCALNGISGPTGVFDGRFGFYKAHVQSEEKFAFVSVVDRLGQHWETLSISPKVYPCGHYNQPLVDAALALRREHKLSAEQILEIRCFLPGYVVPLVAEPAAEKRRPNTSFHGRFSLQHSIAEALVHGTLDKSSFADANLKDPRFNDIADRVQIVVDPLATDRRQLGGKVEMTLADGRQVSASVEHMTGTPQNPMTTDELINKFKSNADGILTESAIDDLAGAIMNLDRLDDVSALPLHGPRRAHQ